MKKVIVLLALTINFSALANAAPDSRTEVKTKVTCREAVKEDSYSVGIVYDSFKNVDYVFVVKSHFKEAYSELVYVAPVSGKRVDNGKNVYSDESSTLQLLVKSNPEGMTAILNVATENIQGMPLSCQTDSAISFDQIKGF